ncbi:NAC domain superfamily [Forsythia ovata]|uniref:NAC domain superfamily n=1 Tax=Forsythia ovata TaxID=205694 RepID=A0ABD1V2R3_9LAMI
MAVWGRRQGRFYEALMGFIQLEFTKGSAQIVDKLSMAFSSRAGYRFMPTDQQVIELYLQAKANGLPLPSDAILDKDLYGKNGTPWVVFSENDPWKLLGSVKSRFQRKKYLFLRS